MERKPVTVQRSWMRQYPSRPFRFWVEVARIVRQRRVRRSDTERIALIIAEVERRWRL